jgi:hypothetical protein
MSGGWMKERKIDERWINGESIMDGLWMNGESMMDGRWMKDR